MSGQTASVVEEPGSAGLKQRWAEHELFEGLDADTLRRLFEAMEHVSVPAGTVLLRQGEVGTELFLINEGRIHVRIEDEAGGVRSESKLDAPTLVGEMALLTQGRRAATVTTLTECRCSVAKAQTFRALLKRNLAAAAFLTRAVGKSLMDAQGIRRVGKYHVVGHLGEGGVATVFEAVHPHLKQHVALKMLSHELVFHPAFAKTFKREAQVIANLHHENIVRVIDTESAYGTHFIVMEKIAGTGLDQLLKRKRKLSYQMLRTLLTELCEALHYCHEVGIIHRDVKPSNVILTDEGRTKLLDFSIATAPEATDKVGGPILGTPCYMSPEQFLERRLDGRSDLYAVGILAYELACGEPPFVAASLAEYAQKHLELPCPDPAMLAPDLPLDLATFIRRATAKDRTARFDSCADAASYLKTAVELPIVERLELTTLAVSYHPSRRALVQSVLRQMMSQLGDVKGVSLVMGHHRARDEDGKPR